MIIWEGLTEKGEFTVMSYRAARREWCYEGSKAKGVVADGGCPRGPGGGSLAANDGGARQNDGCNGSTRTNGRGRSVAATL